MGQVIEGWDVGVLKMSLGEKAILNISYDSAYGEHGIPGAIPPKTDLVFEVELLAIGNKKFMKQLTTEEEQAIINSFAPEDIQTNRQQSKTTQKKKKTNKKK